MIRSTGEIGRFVQVTLETNRSNHEKAKGSDCSEPENPCHGALPISIARRLLSAAELGSRFASREKAEMMRLKVYTRPRSVTRLI